MVHVIALVVALSVGFVLGCAFERQRRRRAEAWTLAQTPPLVFYDDTPSIPFGFVQVTVPGKLPVVVPATAEAAAAFNHLIELVKGDQ